MYTLDDYYREARDLMGRHEDLDWTMAVQAVAMRHGENEAELLEQLRSKFVETGE